METHSGERRALVMAVLRGALVGLFMFGVFAAGWIARDKFLAPGIPTFNGQYPLLAEVQGYLNQTFVRDQPSQTELQYGAIQGLLSKLNDKYTFFVPPPVASNESDVLAGQYGGIGVDISRTSAGDFVLYPYPDSPAAKAGVQNGDILLNAAGTDITPASDQDKVQRLLRGEVKANNGVTFTIKRPPADDQKTFTVSFAVIQVPSVVHRVLEENSALGYVQIKEFTSRTPDELIAAIKDLRSQNITGLVLDLRNNPGGLLDESVKVAGQFLDGGIVLYEHTRTEDTTKEAPKGGLALDLPMVVLINGGSASAAEVVAGALQDRKRATLIGQKSYGKGLVQLIIQLSDKSSLHVTTAEWLTPNKISLDDKGLIPDVVITPDPKGADLELMAAIQFLGTHKTP